MNPITNNSSPYIKTVFQNTKNLSETLEKVFFASNIAKIMFMGGYTIALVSSCPSVFIASAVAHIAIEYFQLIARSGFNQYLSNVNANTQNRFTVGMVNVCKSSKDSFKFGKTYADKNVQNSYQAVLNVLKPKVSASEAQNPVEKASAVEADKNRGPTLNEILSADVMEVIKKSSYYKESVQEFIKKHSNHKVFHFLKNYPGQIRGLEKPLISTRGYEAFPVVNNTKQLSGDDKEEFAKYFFLENTKSRVQIKPEEIEGWKENVKSNDPSAYLEGSTSAELAELVGTIEGAFFLYFLYQALNLHMIEEHHLVDEVNRVKAVHEKTLGNEERKIEWMRDGIVNNNASVILTQEQPDTVQKAFPDGDSYSVFNEKDVCVVLNNNVWTDQEKVAIEQQNDENLANEIEAGKFLAVSATHRETGKRFLFVSAHADSKDCRKSFSQVTLAKSLLDNLRKLEGHEQMELIMGTDSNVKKDEEEKAFDKVIVNNGLKRTQLGHTTKKVRELTTQVSKAGLEAKGPGDFIITTADEFRDVGVYDAYKTFSEKKKREGDIECLPNTKNYSDHTPILAQFFIKA